MGERNVQSGAMGVPEAVRPWLHPDLSDRVPKRPDSSSEADRLRRVERAGRRGFVTVCALLVALFGLSAVGMALWAAKLRGDVNTAQARERVTAAKLADTKAQADQIAAQLARTASAATAANNAPSQPVGGSLQSEITNCSDTIDYIVNWVKSSLPGSAVGTMPGRLDATGAQRCHRAAATS